MAREHLYYHVIQVSDGHPYCIGARKYNKDPNRWEIVDIAYQSPGSVSALDGPTEEEVQKKIEEFTSTDMDLSLPKADDFDYFELLAEVKRLGVEVTGNPKRPVLEELYKEATG